MFIVYENDNKTNYTYNNNTYNADSNNSYNTNNSKDQVSVEYGYIYKKPYSGYFTVPYVAYLIIIDFTVKKNIISE